MRILFADQFSELGGAQIALRELLDEVVQRGWQAEVIAPGTGPLHAACRDRGIHSRSLPLARYSNGHKTVRDILRYGSDSVLSALAIRSAASNLRADLIYANGPRVLPAALWASQSQNIPLILHLHNYLDRAYGRRIAQWCAGQKRVTVITISRFVAQSFVEMADLSRIHTVYNGVADQGFVPRPRAKPGCIGILGRILKQKGQLDFVLAAKALARSRPGLRFVVLGASLFSDDSYEKEVRTAAQGETIEFRGWTNDVSAALHEIDILAVPSGPAEGATRVIMEAFSAGTPVVAYPSGGIPELVSDGETGLLTATRGPQALAHSLGELLDNPALAERLSLQGRREWEARFRLDRWQREICNFIGGLSVPSGVASGLSATTEVRSVRPAPVSADDAGRAAP